MVAPNKEWPSYDAVAKDIFQRDRPTLLNRLTGGLAVGNKIPSVRRL